MVWILNQTAVIGKRTLKIISANGHFTSGRRISWVRILGAYPGCADLRSACLHLSRRPLSCSRKPGADSSLCAPFYLKVALCRGHADRRSAHPAPAPAPAPGILVPLLTIPVIGGSVQLHHPVRPFICNFSNRHVILRVIPLAGCQNNLHL